MAEKSSVDQKITNLKRRNLLVARTTRQVMSKIAWRTTVQKSFFS
jgi:hypothetical protein